MEFKIKSIGYLFLSAALAGCGGGGGDEFSNRTAKPVELKLQESETHPGSHVLSAGKVAEIRKLVPLNDGGSMIIGHYEKKPSSLDATGFMARLDSNLNIVSKSYHKDGYMDACAHTSGEISVAELSKDGEKYGVTLKRYSSNGTLVHKTPLRDSYAENKYQVMNREMWEQSGYLINEFSRRTPDPDYEIRYGGSVHGISYARYNIVKLTCDQERLIAFFNHEGPKITVFDSQLQKEWSQPLSIYDLDNSQIRDRSFAEVAVDDAGNIYGLAEIYQGSIPNYNHRFRSRLPYNIDTPYTRVLVVRKFSRHGRLLAEKIIGTSESSMITGAVVHNGQLYASTNSRIKKHNAENETLEWDIGLFTIDPVNLGYTHTWLDLNRQDWASGITADGDDLYMFGVTGFRQKDSDSIVTNGHGFYKRLRRGNVEDNSYTKVEGERHSVIYDMSVFQGMISAVGVTDAPITHSTDRHSSGLVFRPAR